MPNTFLSIIIPMYNTSNYIIKNLESINNQSDKDFEIIIVDDGSTDDSYNIAKEYLQNVKMAYKIMRIENKGVSNARNLGIKESSGKYILFLDSDDYIEKDLISKCKSFLSQNDSLDVLFFGYDKVDDNNVAIWKYSEQYKYIKKIKTGKEIIYDYFNGKINIWTSSAIYNRNLIINNHITFLEGCHNGEDQNFILKSLARADKVFNINEIMSHYFQRNSSISNSFSIKRLTVINAFEDVCNDFKYNIHDENLVIIINTVIIPANLIGNIKMMIKTGKRKQYINAINIYKVKKYLKNYNKNFLNQNTKTLISIKMVCWFPNTYYFLYKYILLKLKVLI